MVSLSGNYTESDQGDYTEYTVASGSQIDIQLEEGDVWSNNLIDITASNAEYYLHTYGNNCQILNLGIRGQWDGTTKVEQFIAYTTDSNGEVIVDNYYMGDGSASNTYDNGPTGVYVPASHAGTLEVNHMNIDHVPDNAVYGSSPGNPSEHSNPGAGGDVIIRNSYASNLEPAAFRVGTDGSLVENCVAYNAHRGGWAYFNNPTYRDCDFSACQLADYYGGNGSWSVDGTLTLDNSYGSTTSGNIDGVLSGTARRTTAEEVEGVPLTAEEAASGTASGGGGGGGGSDPQTEFSLEDFDISSISDDYSGDVTDFSTGHDGEYYLHNTSTSSPSYIYHSDEYVTDGNTYVAEFTRSEASDLAFTFAGSGHPFNSSFSGYIFLADDDDNECRLSVYENGSRTGTVSGSYAPLNDQIRLEFDFRDSSSSVVADYYDSSGNLIDSISLSDSTHTQGTPGFYHYHNGSYKVYHLSHIDSEPGTGTDPANFGVNILGTNSPVEVGETLEVEYEVMNTGDESGTQDVTLELSDNYGDITMVDDFTGGVNSGWNNNGFYGTIEDGSARGSTAAYPSTGDTPLGASANMAEYNFSRGEYFIEYEVKSRVSDNYSDFIFNADGYPWDGASNGIMLRLNWNQDLISVEHVENDQVSEVLGSTDVQLPVDEYLKIVGHRNNENELRFWIYDNLQNLLADVTVSAPAVYGGYWGFNFNQGGEGSSNFGYVAYNENHPVTGDHYTVFNVDSSTELAPHGIDSDVPHNPEDWTLTFRDEFDQGSLDTDKWGIGFGYGRTHGSTDEYVRDDDVWVDSNNNNLVLQIAMNSTSTSDWYSGAVNTGTPEGSTSQTRPTTGHSQYQGLFEARIRLPEPIEGLLPAFWTKPDDESWPPEIDIIEQFQRQDRVRGTVHYGPNDSTDQGYAYPNTHTDWHVYSAYWRDDAVEFYFDGQLFHTATNGLGSAGDELGDGDPHYLMLSCHMRDVSWLGGSPTVHNNYPYTWEVDWVRAWSADPDSQDNFTYTTIDDFESGSFSNAWDSTGTFSVYDWTSNSGTYAAVDNDASSGTDLEYSGISAGDRFRFATWTQTDGSFRGTVGNVSFDGDPTEFNIYDENGNLADQITGAANYESWFEVTVDYHVNQGEVTFNIGNQSATVQVPHSQNTFTYSTDDYNGIVADTYIDDVRLGTQ